MQSNELSELVQKNIRFSKYGVDFTAFKTNKYIDIISIELFNDFNIQTDSKFYVMWNEMYLPCLKRNIIDIIKYIDDITAVNFDTWLISLDFDVIMEFKHNTIQVGIGNTQKH